MFSLGEGVSLLTRTSASTSQQPRRTIFDFGLDSLDRLGAKIASGQDLTSRCAARSFGTGWGHHLLCTLPKPKPPCFFYSFGISSDYSFDSDLANSTGCIGLAADPTVEHPSKLHPRVYFVPMGAKDYEDSPDRRFALRASVPGLRVLMGHEHIHTLKMDCEGCEYSLARDVLEEDPGFFSRVDNFAVEVHYSRHWLKSTAHLQALAALVQLLEEAGMDLVHFELSGCAQVRQETGILPEMGPLKLFAALTRQTHSLHCHNYLFARI